MSVSAPLPSPHNPFAGQVLGGRYRVDRLIGRGGMGLIYLGWDMAEDRELVLKVLSPHWAQNAHAVARFEREGALLSELKHPNIVECFDVGRHDGQTYIAMEFIRGLPLRKLLAEKGRLSLDEFFPIAASLLSAVAHAHERGVMVRDLKPSNVMLCERGGAANYVKLLDFGLAKRVGEDDVDANRTHVVGTAGFLAPELIRGGPSDVRVDVYALSIMFFIMLTGSSPIVGENDGSVLYNHVHGVPKRFVDVLPRGETVPRVLQALIDHCMAKSADDRPGNAGAVLGLLRTCAEPGAFKLPVASLTSRRRIDRYWHRKQDDASRGVRFEAPPSSTLWTRPRLRRLLEGTAADAAELKASVAGGGGGPKLSSMSVESEAARRHADPSQPTDGAGPRAPSRSGDTWLGLPAVPVELASDRRAGSSMAGRSSIAQRSHPWRARGLVPTAPPAAAGPRLTEPHDVWASGSDAAHSPGTYASGTRSAELPASARAAAELSGRFASASGRRRRRRRVGMLVAVAVGVAASMVLGGVSTWVLVGSSGAPGAPPGSALDPNPNPNPNPAPRPKGAEGPEVEGMATGLAGSLSVAGPPGAVVFVNGQRVGHAPATRSLRPGTYIVRVEAPGFEHWERSVELGAQGHEKLVAEPVPADASASPEGARRASRTRRSRAKRNRRGVGAEHPSGLDPQTAPVPTPAGQPVVPPPSQPAPPTSASQGEKVFMMRRKPSVNDGVFLPVGKD